jgi:hypothetical protein
MEPFSALAVATSIIQFLDFSAKVVSKGNLLRKSATGALAENDEIEGLAVRLQGMAEGLKPSAHTLQLSQTQSDQALQTICDESIR